jgi:sugar phosphate isomerase/epimerase
MGRDNEPAQSLLDHGELLAHVHVAEFPTRTPPGVEGCDFGPYFSALARAGYGGRFSLECAWEDLPAQAAPAVADLRADLERAGF